MIPCNRARWGSSFVKGITSHRLRGDLGSWEQKMIHGLCVLSGANEILDLVSFLYQVLPASSWDKSNASRLSSKAPRSNNNSLWESRGQKNRSQTVTQATLLSISGLHLFITIRSSITIYHKMEKKPLVSRRTEKCPCSVSSFFFFC